MRYFIKFSYDGSVFNGYQRQKDLKTVQSTIENSLSELEGKKVEIHASGRTDKGVHALNQCAHFDLDKDLKEYNLKKYLNNSFDGEIYVKKVEKKNDKFHARYNVISKSYSYYINQGEFDPIKRNYVYQLCQKLDVQKIVDATNFLVGKHDFRAFVTDSSEDDNTIREIYLISVEESNDILKITFKGNGFLRKMIRNVVAILIEIGLNKKDVSYMKDVLDSKKREGNMKSVPGCGLYLEEVSYD